MKLVKPSVEILRMRSGKEILQDLERFARTCYKSEERITAESAATFLQMLVHDKKHRSVLRHDQATVRFICSRGTSHQLVRHGLAHFLQESQRYCNYSKKNSGEVIFVLPWYYHDTIAPGVYHSESEIRVTPPSAGVRVWLRHLFHAEETYHGLVKCGQKPERARGVLPNDAKTEVVVTANLEEWRHIFAQRADSHADEAMQFLMYPLLDQFKQRVSVLFDDLGTSEEHPQVVTMESPSDFVKSVTAQS